MDRRIQVVYYNALDLLVKQQAESNSSAAGVRFNIGTARRTVGTHCGAHRLKT